VLQFDATELKDELARLRGALEGLQRVGVRLALNAGCVVDTDLSRLLAIEAFGVVKFARTGDSGAKAEAAWEPWSKSIAEARSLGKVAVATDIGMADIGVLLRLGVHYAQGDALSGWHADWNFDFAEAVL
jgi:hypothetical protein